jgi:hypothetical protein
MPDDPGDRERRNRERINVLEPWQVKHWTNAFECTEAQLRAAVGAVGANVDAVRKHLWKSDTGPP